MIDMLGQMDILLDESKVSLKLNSGVYDVRRMTMGDVAALQNKMKKQFGRPVGPEEIFTEIATPEGAMFVLWRRLKETDPSLTVEQVQDMIPATPDALGKLMKLLGLEASETIVNPPIPAVKAKE